MADNAHADAVIDHPLYPVLAAAIAQCLTGKGERHGGGRTAFLGQPWAHYAELHGRGFLTGQAAKKLEEAASTRSGSAFEAEALGAIVYIGMAILHERAQHAIGLGDIAKPLQQAGGRVLPVIHQSTLKGVS